MKNIPKIIYLKVDSDKENPEDYKDIKGIALCEYRINKKDLQYIHIDTVQELVNFFSGKYIDKKYITGHIHLNQLS